MTQDRSIGLGERLSLRRVVACLNPLNSIRQLKPLQKDTASEQYSKHVELEPDVQRIHSIEDGTLTTTILDSNTNFVTWNGEDDPENPRNWPRKSKWITTMVMSAFVFISPISSTMAAPGLSEMAQDLGSHSEVEQMLFLSIFVLGFAMAPLFLGPLSEVFGRVWVLQISTTFFLIWNFACGFAQTPVQMLVFRLLSGIGGSASYAIGGGILSDCWAAEERGKAIGIYTLAPLLGPAVGPIAGGFLVEKTTWRWVFWSISIADILVQACGLLLLKETYAPVILKRKTAYLRHKLGKSELYSGYDDQDQLLSTIGKAFFRPCRLLTTQPIVQLISTYIAYLFGIFFLLLSTFPGVWEDVYHENVAHGSLNYLSLALGYLVAGQINSFLSDAIYRRLKRRNNGLERPEYRIVLVFLGSALTPFGLLWYGWSVEKKLHWIMPNIGAVICGLGATFCISNMQAYTIETYTTYAASCLGAVAVMRSLGGFAFPLFAPAMYHTLGYGWGNSVLALAAVVIGVPIPLTFWFYGEKLRKMSKYSIG